MIWGNGYSKLGDWGIVDRHRKRAYAEGFRDGAIVGCFLAVAGGIFLRWVF
jgi:hypothetical protein